MYFFLSICNFLIIKIIYAHYKIYGAFRKVQKGGKKTVIQLPRGNQFRHFGQFPCSLSSYEYNLV